MSDWIVSGPFKVPVDTLASGAHFIDEAKLDELKDETDEFGRPGVYVFCVRTRGTLPIYVGMTQSQTLFVEAFKNDKLQKINRYINEHPRGTLLMYLITQIRGGGRPNVSDIEKIEWWLIGLAERRNDDLINSQTPGRDSWTIKGVHNSRGGRRTATEDLFRDMIGISPQKKDAPEALTSDPPAPDAMPAQSAIDE